MSRQLSLDLFLFSYSSFFFFFSGEEAKEKKRKGEKEADRILEPARMTLSLMAHTNSTCCRCPDLRRATPPVSAHTASSLGWAI
jgi:hypothetical protein